MNNNSKQSPEEHNNGPRHSQEDDQRQNTNNQQSEQAKPRMHNKQSSQVKTPVESADKNPTYSGAQSPEQCVVLIGDSIIKNIIPHTLSLKKVYKFTYPGKLAEEIESEIRDIL